MLKLSDSSLKTPMADSYIKIKKIRHWITAGNDISRVGSAGIPSDIDDRERKTVVWYKSFQKAKKKKKQQMISRPFFWN